MESVRISRNLRPHRIIRTLAFSWTGISWTELTPWKNRRSLRFEREFALVSICNDKSVSSGTVPEKARSLWVHVNQESTALAWLPNKSSSAIDAAQKPYYCGGRYSHVRAVLP